MKKQLGYNFVFAFKGKKFAGVTDDNLQITPTVKESITKDDKGASNSEVVGQGIEITVNGIISLKDGDAEPQQMDADDIMELNLKKGEEAIVEFVYTRSTGRAYTGRVRANGYSESTGAEDFGTYSQSFTVVGEMTPQEQ